jgi:hypothetical protein
MKGKKRSETIPKGSTPVKGETVRLFKFYVLIDPRDEKTKYLGRTVDEKNRLRCHIYEAKKNNRNKRERWIMYLLRKNMKPKLKIIYKLNCTLEEAIQTEKTLVKKLLKRGFKLKNSPDSYLGAVNTGKKVYQYDLEGNLIDMFINASVAMQKTGVKDSNIGRCAKNENGYGTKTAGGFFWSFIKYNKYPYKFLKNWRSLKGKEVCIYNLENVLIGCYPTARIAAKQLGINYKKISACANGRQKTISRKYIAKFK